MNNIDLSNLATLADAARQLIENKKELKGDELQEPVTQWVALCQKTLAGLGESEQFKQLKDTFSLNQGELGVIGLLLLPEINAKFDNFFQSLFQDVSCRKPTIGLVTKLCTASFEEQSQLINLLNTTSALRTWGLVGGLKPAKDSSADRVVYASKELIDWFLFSIGVEFKAGLEESVPETPAGIALLEPSVLELTADKGISFGRNTFFGIVGGFPERRKAIAERIAKNELQQLAFQVEIEDLKEEGKEAWERIFRFLGLLKAVLYWEEGGRVLSQRPWLMGIVYAWRKLPGSLLILGEKYKQTLPVGLLNKAAGSKMLPPLKEEGGIEVWRQAGAHYLENNLIHWGDLNAVYNLNFSRIEQSLVALQQSEYPQESIDVGKVKSAWTYTSPMLLKEFATRVLETYKLYDLTLQGATRKSLITLSERFVQRLKSNVQTPEGLIAIFAGNSGTEFERAPIALGNELGLPVFRVNCDVFCTKSEQCADAIQGLFEEARNTTALVWFDHADALFTDTAPRSACAKSSLIQEAKKSGCLVVFTSRVWNPVSMLGREAHSMLRFPNFNTVQRVECVQKQMELLKVRLAPEVNLGVLMKGLPVNKITLDHIVANAAFMAGKRLAPGPPLITLRDFQTAINAELK